jgi:flagellar basal body-associated protein FliL
MNEGMMPAAEPQKKSRTGLIIVIVVVLLCVCCAGAAAAAWSVGDPIMNIIGNIIG